MKEPAVPTKAPEVFSEIIPAPSKPAVPPRSSIHPVLQLQSAVGNQAVQHFIQAKLTISQPNDPYEKEPDRIADQVMTTPAYTAVSGAPPRIQRFSAQSNGQVDKVPASVDQALASPGRPLEPVLRGEMEQRFGYDFSLVRVHCGASAEQSAQDVNANAYTLGHNIVFGAGRFAPATQEGRRLLAHELTHVLQQADRDRIECIPCDGDGLLTLQQASGNRAVVGQLQRDKAKTVANDHWTRVVDGYNSLIWEIGMVNQKVMSPIRSEWLNELATQAAQIGGPGDLDAATLGRLEAGLAKYKKMIDQNVTSAREHWKELLEEYEKERATLTDGQGWHPRALKFLDQQAKDDRNTVFFGWKYLTFDDTAGLESMLYKKTHVRLVEQQDEEERRRRHKEDSRKVPLFLRFRIRALAGGQLSAGPVGADVTTFEIEELGPRGRSGMITFKAVGLAVGLKAGALGSQSWTEFTTPAEMRIEDFEGAGRLTSASGYLIYGGGVSVLTFFPGSKPTVQVKSWGHGWGLGGGAETIVGIWTVRSVD